MKERRNGERGGKKPAERAVSFWLQPDETSFALPLVGVLSQIMFDSDHLGEPH